MEHAILRLSRKEDHADIMDLRFRLLDNQFTVKWIDRVLEAQQKQYAISEPWAIYNINNELNPEFIKNNLNRLMCEVDREQKLFEMQIEDINDQDSLNKIHSIFERTHGQLDKWKTNPIFENKSEMFRKNLSEINQFVHACESINGYPRIRVVWFDLPKYKTFDIEDYKLFTNTRTFGSLYHLYSDVGKNIESLANDNDEHHHDVVPNLHYSADCVIEFSDRDAITVEKIEQKQREYIRKNQNMLKDKGFEISDPRLTTGKIEIAKLVTDLSQQELLSRLKKYNHIQSFSVS